MTIILSFLLGQTIILTLEVSIGNWNSRLPIIQWEARANGNGYSEVQKLE